MTKLTKLKMQNRKTNNIVFSCSVSKTYEFPSSAAVQKPNHVRSKQIRKAKRFSAPSEIELLIMKSFNGNGESFLTRI